MGGCSQTIYGNVYSIATYTVHGQCLIKGPFTRSFNLTVYGEASLQGGGSSSSVGSINVKVRDKGERN